MRPIYNQKNEVKFLSNLKAHVKNVTVRFLQKTLGDLLYILENKHYWEQKINSGNFEW